jgi:hypothetical protein
MLKKSLFWLWYIVVAGVVGIAIRHGLLVETANVDTIGVSWLIIVLFFLAYALGALAFFGYPVREHLRGLANHQVYFGVFGTILGAYMSLRGVDVGSNDAVLQAVPQLMMALWTSVIGMAGGGITIITFEILGGEPEQS